MEAIHGITFEDYAATNAFLAQGKDIKELLPTLGIEHPQWDEANSYWENQMANDPDFKLVTIFGEVFSNPARGKYAGAATQTTGDALEKISSFEEYIDVGAQMSVASKYGVDAQSMLAERGLTVMDWSQAGMHWGQYHLNKVRELSGDAEAERDFNNWFTDTTQKYNDHYEARYNREAGGSLTDDIAF